MEQSPTALNYISSQVYERFINILFDAGKGEASPALHVKSSRVSLLIAMADLCH